MKFVCIEDEDHKIPMTVLEDQYPWYAEIVELDGGWLIFESAQDFYTWEKQV